MRQNDLSPVVIVGVHVCGKVIDLFIFMTRMQSKCEIYYCNAASERGREPLWDEGGGR